MYPTTEVRWFVPGAVPKEAEHWFELLGPAVETARRTDHYLIPSSAGEPGIKLREGRIDVKARMSGLGVQCLTSGVEGIVEIFSKWSFPLVDGASTPQEGWVDVAKVRRLRSFAIEDGEVVEVNERSKIGCDMELCEVRLAERIWWTLCLEAFGTDETVRLTTLRRTAERALPTLQSMLDVGRSTGYVGWLCQVGR